MPPVTTRPIPSAGTLERALPRALELLRGIARYPEIAVILAEHGYTNAEHALGWELVGQAGGRDLVLLPVANPNLVQQAIAELDQWDEPNLRKASKALLRSHPDQHAFVFNALQAAVGLEAVLVVSAFLDRLDRLEAGPDREPTREADHAALKTLADRGITRAERDRLRALIKVARSIPTATPAELQRAAAEREQRMFEALVDLHYWWDDWAEVARQHVSRRRHRLALGLAVAATPAAQPAESAGGQGAPSS